MRSCRSINLAATNNSKELRSHETISMVSASSTRDISFSPFIIQKIPVRLLRRSLVRAQIEVTGGNEPVVAQDFLDMPDRAPVEQEGCGNGMAEQVRGHRLGKADHLSESPEPNERRVESQRSSTPAYHKERLTLVLAPGHVFFNPIQRARTEK